ncbi:MAG: excinuclease ABC subunit UvrC [Saprospiraceae bacterium]|nr:excinuclease ABC subunit UvrC [Saprospiraceae bacterium]
MVKEDFSKISADIPRQPGVYRFIDAKETVLYVGKAKNLKNRLSSYFNAPQNQMNKTRVMVKHAKRIEFTLVENESDAFLLENSLIKKFQPRYNVNLKDGKSYTYVCIKNERFPRVFFTRKLIKDGSKYFGPYTSKWRTGVLLDLIRDLFPLRTCTYDLSEESIQKGKYKVCLEYHIKNCLGPCVGLEDEASYLLKIEQVKNILSGNFKPVREHLHREMKKAADDLDFEKAQHWKGKLVAFEDYQGKSLVASTHLKDIDVFSIVSDPAFSLVHYMKVLQGSVVNTYVAELEAGISEDPGELLSFAIPRIREKFESIAPEVIVPVEVDLPEELKITIPQRGDKRKLLEMSDKNLTYYQMQKKQEIINRKQKQTSAERILKTLQSDLQMDDLPLQIECFDNSNMQGSFPVASCVVFKNAKPAKSDYRHFNIKTVVGPDDFASMEEVVFRRYRRLLDEEKPLPQLVIIDGGKGQLSAAMKSINQLELADRITVVGIAKRLEEIYFPGDSVPLYINKKSESLKLIQQLRNEAHRFAITFHRNQRSRNFTSTELTQISGIGDKTADRLLKHFRSVKKVRSASEREIRAVVGKKNAQTIVAHFEALKNADQEE